MVQVDIKDKCETKIDTNIDTAGGRKRQHNTLCTEAKEEKIRGLDKNEMYYL